MLAAALGGVLLTSGVAASTASAFTGESVVLNPGKTDLTGPAKTILEKPTFLPDSVTGAEALGGVDEGSDAAAVFEGSTLLPALGSVISFGVGTVVGSEICHVIGLEGCWYFSSEGADPEPVAKTYKWEFATVGEFPFNWKWSRGAVEYEGINGSLKGCGSQTPVGWQRLFHWTNIEDCGVKTTTQTLWRDSMANRNLEYHATDSGSIANYEPGGKSYAASSEWSKNLAAGLKEKSDSTVAGRLGKHIASKIEGSKVADPYPHEVTVPSCVGLTAASCLVVLEELGLTPSVANLSYLEAVIPSANLDEPILSLEAQAEKVQKLSPTSGTKVMSTSTVTVTANPKLAGMPIIVPDDPAPGESVEAWKAKRITPQTSEVTVNPEVLGEAFTNPHYSAESVVRPVPEPGTRLDPATSHEVDVRVNSADAPAPAGAWTAPVIPSIDLTPFSGVAIGCGSFPFGIFCWIGEGLTSWGTSGICPNFSIPFITNFSSGAEHPLEVDFCQFEPAMEIIRPVLVVLACFTLAAIFAYAALGIGGDAASGDD